MIDGQSITFHGAMWVGGALEWQVIRRGILYGGCGGDGSGWCGSRGGLRGCGGAICLLRGCCGGYGLDVLAVGAFAKELQVIYNNLCGFALSAGLVLPLAGAQVAFYKHLSAFADELFCNVGGVSPGDDCVPFGVLLAPLLRVFC